MTSGGGGTQWLPILPGELRPRHCFSPGAFPLSTQTNGRLILEDGTEFEGLSFGATQSLSGEVVFNTGMVGYPEALTDPSYRGQILTCTFPLIGNYGVPHRHANCEIGLPFESDCVQIAGLIVSDYSQHHSHWDAEKSLGDWLKENGVPGLSGIDTRGLTKKLREHGTMLGKIVFGDAKVDLHDQNEDNLVADVSPREPKLYGEGNPHRIVMIDCGGKNNIISHLTRRGFEVLRVPYDHDLEQESFRGIMVSNGPGDPKMCHKTIRTLRRQLQQRTPIFGICLGHQLLSLAIGADTYKLKYGHRSQNQPVIESQTDRCFITSQNHGFAVDARSLPDDWEPWFTNLNDGTNEGIRHKTLPVRSCQFHPEAAPGPVDTGYLFDEFLEAVAK